MTEPKRCESLISGAIEAVGEQRRDDYVIAPAAHAEEFAARAPLLSAILRAEPIRIAAAEYEDLDAKALKAQARFKTTASLANLGVFLATCFAAGVLMVGNLAKVVPSNLSSIAFVALGIASALAAALSAKWLHEIRVGKLLQKWMTARSAAETQRLRYFDLAIQRSYADSSDEPDLTALLQLEYFRRFQLAAQLAFLRERGSDHERAANQTISGDSISIY